ncbi:MAG: hypothetical protein H6662_09375 [Ardenticatenaceae bacterium]|nr:hypothetical protein [Anaerolineales bacterium]MCB8921782.1 hypothetical protein [Ardenticatenaceae bacterium]MCB8990699.1 hypothetical protein [Ardenticatenaceae bacterium]
MRKLWQRYCFPLGAATAVLFATLLYWPTLRLPIIYDSILHIRIVKGLNLATVWLPTQAFGFYRPFTFVPILLIKAMFGYYPAWLFHAMNVVQHAANAGLLIWLTWRLWGSGQRALLAGVIFAVYPFSYQAVAVYGHNVHPAITGLLLLGLHSYLSALRTGQNRWWWLTAVLFLISLLTHETAVLFGVFAFLVQWNETGEWGVGIRPFRFNWRAPWLWFLLAGMAYLVAYQFFPIDRAPQAATSGEADWVLSGLYLLQGLVFPAAWFAHFGVNGRFLILGGIVLVGGTSLWLLRKQENRAALALAWGWWGLAAALIGLALPVGYLLHGPRLLYLSSVGVAVLWALLLEPLLAARRWAWLGTAVFIFILLSSGQFVDQHLTDYARLTAPVHTIASEMADKPPTDGILVVNLPGWLDEPQPTYAIGVEFVSMLGNYLFVEELLGENLRVNHPAQAVALPTLLQEVPYGYGLHKQTDLQAVQWGQGGTQHVFIISYLPDGPQARYVGAVQADSEQASPIASFGPYQLLQTAVTPAADGGTAVATTWRLTDAVPATTSLFLQALDAQGQLVAQSDGPPLGLPPNLFDTTGFLLHDVRHLPPTVMPPATFLLGVYDYLDGNRFPAFDAQERPLPDNALRLEE